MTDSNEKGLYNLIFKKKFPNWMYAILFVVYILAIAVWVLSNT